MTATGTGTVKTAAPASVAPLAADLDAALRRLKLATVRRNAAEVLQVAKTQRWTPPLTGIRVDAFVVDPRGFHAHGPRGGQHLAFAVVAVAHHQPIPVLVDLTQVGVDVGGDLGLQRSREHRSCTITHDLVEQRPARRAVLVGRIRVVDYREQGRTLPNQRANAGS